MYFGISYLLPKTQYHYDITGQNNLVLPLKGITLYIETISYSCFIEENSYLHKKVNPKIVL